MAALEMEDTQALNYPEEESHHQQDWTSSHSSKKTQRTNLGVLSLQFRGGGGGSGCGRDCGPGKTPDPAPGRGSDPPLSHQGAPLLFQCF